MRLTILLTSALCIIAQPLAAQVPSGVRDGSHDFDFSSGRWTTDVTIIKDPFNKPAEQVHMKGTKVARPIWNGKAWIEEIEADGPGGHWQAANVFLYDPVASQWSENYVDSSTGRMETPSIGGYHNGDLEFYAQEFIGGRAVLTRGTWKIQSRDAHSYEVARSIDGGRSWHTSFIARVSRAR